MGAPPRMGQHSSQQRRVPLVASSGPPQQQEQRSSSTTVSGAITANQSQSSGVGGVKSTRARARTQAQVRAAVVAAAAAAAAAGATSVGIKRSVHSRLADMAAAPLTPTKRQRRRPPPSELVMLSLASSSSSPTCYPRSAKALAGYRGAAVKQHRSVAGVLQRAGAAAGGPIPASATAISTSTTSAPKSSTSAPKNSTSSSLGVVMVASTTTTTTMPLTNGSHAPSSASATSAISAASPAGAIEDRKPVESELRRTRHERAAHSGALSGSSKISSASTTTTTTTSSLTSSLLSATSSTTTATTTTSVLSPRLLASPANVVVKIERTAFDEARPDEQLRQAEMLAQKDEEIRRLRDEIARLQGQVATLEEQLADSERMRPPSAASTTMLTAATTTTTTTPQRMQRDHRCLVNASSTSCGQINDRKARKTVRLLDPSGSRAAELNNGAEQSSSSLPSPLIPMAVLPYSLYQRALDADDDHDTDASRRPDGAIEVPRWREKPIEAEVTASSKGHGENLPEEATGDEVYLKRHLKLETYEKRRKRWDRQWLSEQKSFERARRRQARRQSGGSSTSTGTIGGNGCSQLYGPMGLSPRSPDAGPTVKTLFPSGNRLQAIEITDHVPVVAWGCNVPQFQHREFSLE